MILDGCVSADQTRKNNKGLKEQPSLKRQNWSTNIFPKRRANYCNAKQADIAMIVFERCLKRSLLFVGK